MNNDSNTAAPVTDTTPTFDSIVQGMYTPDGFSRTEWDPSWYSTD
ncbi:MAG: hypothetical protein JWN09_2985 [Microbacteriaceae bacterium]|jgi:hypothetical protein|nr:hypothetical protein [Microbacteriaceae bacterium]